MGPVRVHVRDHYLDGTGAVAVRAFGIVPMGGERGPDTARSSRGRLAAEACWVPTALVPGPLVRWTAVDDERARVTQQIDGHEESVEFEVARDGRLRAVRMERWGDVGSADGRHAALPYGFGVEEEQTIRGLTIPVSLAGGWWFGTDRFDPAASSRFRITGAVFR
jgi:hypothetical protein